MALLTRANCHISMHVHKLGLQFRSGALHDTHGTAALLLFSFADMAWAQWPLRRGHHPYFWIHHYQVRQHSRHNQCRIASAVEPGRSSQEQISIYRRALTKLVFRSERRAAGQASDGDITFCSYWHVRNDAWGTSPLFMNLSLSSRSTLPLRILPHEVIHLVLPTITT